MIYWITDNIGTVSVTELASWPKDVEIINLLDFEDGWNEPFLIYCRLKESLLLLSQGKKVIFCCQAGISRSNAFATTLVAYLKKLDWDDAYNITRQKCRRAFVNLELREACVEALDMMRNLLTKQCQCGMPIEEWETVCFNCWQRERVNVE